MCALLTLAATRGSAPRRAGFKMVDFADGGIAGTIGGVKFEALAVEDARAVKRRRPILLVSSSCSIRGVRFIILGNPVM